MRSLLKDMQAVVKLAQTVGEAVMEIYRQPGDILFQEKADASPLTIADQKADVLIASGLKALTPDIPVLSEECCDVSYAERAQWTRYWLVDPLDGTQEFLHRTGDFTINIALIDHHHPIMGVVYAPVRQWMYYALAGGLAYKSIAGGAPHAISTRVAVEPLQVVASRRHGGEGLNPFLAQLPSYELVQMGSALKLCWVAEGQADIYPRFGLTSEWDTAAAQCILEAAGGAVVNLQGTPLQCNTRDSIQNPYFLAIGDRDYPWLSKMSSS